MLLVVLDKYQYKFVPIGTLVVLIENTTGEVFEVKLPLQTETEYDVGISAVLKFKIKLLDVNDIFNYLLIHKYLEILLLF